MNHDNGGLAEKRKKVSSVEKRKASGKKAVSSKVSDRKTSGQRRAVPVRKGTGGKKEVYDRKTSDEKMMTAGAQPKAVKSAEEESREEFEARMRRRDEERARRRAEREKKVRRQKIIMLVSSCVILVCVIGILVFCLSPIKLAFRLFQGEQYASKEAYEKAQTAYEKALQIDTNSVKAYRGLADNYEKQQMDSEAEQILYQGWEQTQDEGLLRYYSVVVLNQAVAQINAGNCTWETVDKCVRVLEQGSEEQKALELLEACRERLFKVTEEETPCEMFYDEDVTRDTCSYTEYEQLLRRMLAVCQSDASEESRNLLKQYAVIGMPYMSISLPHMEAYTALLTEINTVLNDNEIAETVACLARAKEVQEYFGQAFEEFASGNYAYARELVTDEEYQGIRDDFIEEDSGYWEGAVYIPIRRDLLVLHREAESVRFFFPDEEAYENHQGILLVWGTHQEDDGVQRSVISYEPPAETDTDTKTEYTVQYLYSNVKINGEYVPQMNYRFDTKITTSEGITTNAIGDWGGEHEWEIDY